MKQTAMITGANSGIGLELTKLMIAKGWAVIALIRSDFPLAEASVQNAISSGSIDLYKADLSDLVSLKSALEHIKAKQHKIDVLFNNAGVSLDHFKPLTTKRDLHFEVNTLAPYIVCQEMRQLLLKGQHKMIINTSSNALLYVKKFDPRKLLNPEQGRFKKLFGIYAASKLALSLWTLALAPTFSKVGIHIKSVDPGGSKTAMTAGEGMPTWLLIIRNFFFAHPSKGARALLAAAFQNPQTESGSFMVKGKEMPIPHNEYAAELLATVDLIYRNEYAVLNPKELH